MPTTSLGSKAENCKLCASTPARPAAPTPLTIPTRSTWAITCFGIEGEDEEERPSRTAAVHLGMLAPRVRAKTHAGRARLLGAAMDYARTHADWFSEEDAEAYDTQAGRWLQK